MNIKFEGLLLSDLLAPKWEVQPNIDEYAKFKNIIKQYESFDRKPFLYRDTYLCCKVSVKSLSKALCRDLIMQPREKWGNRFVFTVALKPFNFMAKNNNINGFTFNLVSLDKIK